MRVLQISEGFVGAQKTVELRIHHFLRKNGHDSKILYAVGDPAGDPDIVPFEKKWDSYIRRGLWKYCGHCDQYAYFQTRRIIREIKNFAPDIVHIHVIHHGFVNFKLLMNFLNDNQIRIVYTLHDLWAVTGGCYHYTCDNCHGYLQKCSECRRKEADLDCRQNKTGKNYILKRQMYENSDGIRFVAVSQWLEKEANQLLDGSFPVQTIYNGVHLEDAAAVAAQEENEIIRRIELEKNGRIVIIGGAASWTTNKGIDQFIELARLLGDRYWIILAGHVLPEVAAASPANMTYLGYISNRTLLWALYRHADLHVSMSLEETFGMTFVEAALNGVKSFGFSSTAIPEILSQVDGVAVSPFTAEAMANAIQKHCPAHFTADQIEVFQSRFAESEMEEAYYACYKAALTSQTLDLL